MNFIYVALILNRISCIDFYVFRSNALRNKHKHTQTYSYWQLTVSSLGGRTCRSKINKTWHPQKGKKVKFENGFHSSAPTGFDRIYIIFESCFVYFAIITWVMTQHRLVD